MSIGIKIKIRKVSGAYRYGTATLRDGTKVKCRRRKIFNDYEYYRESLKETIEITDQVTHFRVEEYIDERGEGKDRLA